MERHAASEFFLGDFAVTAARTHKDAAEQELMRMSSAANDTVMADVIKLVHEGVTEREIADQMLGLYRKHGCEGDVYKRQNPWSPRGGWKAQRDT